MSVVMLFDVSVANGFSHGRVFSHTPIPPSFSVGLGTVLGGVELMLKVNK